MAPFFSPLSITPEMLLGGAPAAIAAPVRDASVAICELPLVGGAVQGACPESYADHVLYKSCGPLPGGVTRNVAGCPKRPASCDCADGK